MVIYSTECGRCGTKESFHSEVLMERHVCPCNKKPLLTIELQDESSVPKVFYKGEEIKLKTNIYFDWDTDTDLFGGLTYAIEHYEEGNKFPTLKRIERKVKGHA